MDWEEAEETAKDFIKTLDTEAPSDFVGSAKKVAQELRDARAFDVLDYFIEQLGRRRIQDAEFAKLRAQSLIDRGKAGMALMVLPLIVDSIEAVEAYGLMGRANKQIFFDTEDKTSKQAISALTDSFNYYKKAYEIGPTRASWAGVNLLALAAFAQRKSIPLPPDIDLRRFAQGILELVDKQPPESKRVWDEATKAEACLGLGNGLDDVERHISAYVRSDDTSAFALASTLRQFTALWELDKGRDQARGIVQALQAALLRKADGWLDVTPQQISQAVKGPMPNVQQLQKILGPDGVETYRWWRTGLERARAVGVISDLANGRIGTGFLVAAQDVIPSYGNEPLVMTNAHVVSDSAEDGAPARPEDATIVFEAADKNAEYKFATVVWRSPRHDCILLSLKPHPQGIDPLPFENVLPERDSRPRPRVYIVGYPQGRDLAFSLQGNRLLDHEGDPGGTPEDRSVRRLQYRAPTAGGSSGSPVFESRWWKVIGLHHAGGDSMRKLNGQTGMGPANEGIWIQSILDAIRETLKHQASA